jgi:hypothetical protein
MPRFEPLPVDDLKLVDSAEPQVRILRHPTLDAYLAKGTIRAAPPSPLEAAVIDYLASIQLRRAA